MKEELYVVYQEKDFILGEKLIEIATGKAENPDYSNKHGNKAKLGWYRYDTSQSLSAQTWSKVLFWDRFRQVGFRAVSKP